jgi:hypothetical protein
MIILILKQTLNKYNLMIQIVFINSNKKVKIYQQIYRIRMIVCKIIIFLNQLSNLSKIVKSLSIKIKSTYLLLIKILCIIMIRILYCIKKSGREFRTDNRKVK